MSLVSPGKRNYKISTDFYHFIFHGDFHPRFQEKFSLQRFCRDGKICVHNIGSPIPHPAGRGQMCVNCGNKFSRNTLTTDPETQFLWTENVVDISSSSNCGSLSSAHGLSLLRVLVRCVLDRGTCLSTNVELNTPPPRRRRMQY